SSALIFHKSLPVVLGNSYGQLELPDSLPPGAYTIRAYSATMLNLDTAFLFHRTVFISGKKNTAIVSQKDNEIRLEFFPESGNFVSGLMNSVAFKATDQSGMPVAVKGLIYNQKDEKILDFASIH